MLWRKSYGPDQICSQFYVSETVGFHFSSELRDTQHPDLIQLFTDI